MPNYGAWRLLKRLLGGTLGTSAIISQNAPKLSLSSPLPYKTAGIFLSFISKKSKMSINDAEVKKQVSICSIFSTFYSFVISVSLALHVLDPPARVHTEGRRRFCCRSNI